MDYEKKLKLAKEALDSGSYDKETIEYLFPELIESEDEKIRNLIKDIVISFKNGRIYNVGVEEFGNCLAWLDKQGERTCTNNGLLDKFTDEEYKRMFGSCKLPKFKVGDWITDNEAVFYIRSYYIDYGYQLETQKGISFHFSDEKVENKYHLWSIQDAKDGDVLDANGAPFIYKKHDEYYVYFYCGVNLAGEFIEANENDTWNINNKIYPATKEQRGLLFQKMKEASYEWDAEKKDLKWLITNGGDFEPAWSEDERIKKGIVHLIQCVPEIEWCKADVSIGEVQTWLEKQAEKEYDWGEKDDDDAWLNDIVSKIESGLQLNKAEINWVKSLKDRVQPLSKQEWRQDNVEELTDFERAMMHIGGSFFGEHQGLDPNDTSSVKEQAQLLLELAQKPAWSEEDEEMLSEIITDVKAAQARYPESQMNQIIIEEEVKWLKSLKQRIGG